MCLVYFGIFYLQDTTQGKQESNETDKCLHLGDRISFNMKFSQRTNLMMESLTETAFSFFQFSTDLGDSIQSMRPKRSDLSFPDQWSCPSAKQPGGASSLMRVDNIGNYRYSQGLSNNRLSLPLKLPSSTKEASETN